MRHPAPATQAALEIIRAKGHLVNWFINRNGDIRYQVDGNPRPLTAYQLTHLRRFKAYGL
jgi:hypothetical protein